MALVKCPDCGREVSDAAPSCPGCGRPVAAAPPPPRRPFWKRPIGKPLLATLAVWIVGSYIFRSINGPKLQVKCLPSGTAYSCSAESVGGSPAKACWDVVVTCTKGEHRTHGCSHAVPPGATETYALPAVDPPITDMEQCTNTRLENMVIE
jgi:hypothetical protein